MINLQPHAVGRVVQETDPEGVLWSHSCVEVDSLNKFEAIHLLMHAQVHLIFDDGNFALYWRAVLWRACVELRIAIYSLLGEIEDGAH